VQFFRLLPEIESELRRRCYPWPPRAWPGVVAAEVRLAGVPEKWPDSSNMPLQWRRENDAIGACRVRLLAETGHGRGCPCPESRHRV